MPAAQPEPSSERRLICTACEQLWEAAIVPKSQWEQLCAAVAGLDEAKRQIALLRLILSKDQLERAERPIADVIPLRRAA